MTCASFRFLAAAGVLSVSIGGADAVDYERSELVSGVPGHGINGLAFGPDGKLYGSSMLGTGFLKVDVSTGVHERILNEQPSGDDLAFSPRGELTWTALRMNEVRQRGSDGVVRAIATDLPWINPIVFAPDGTLYLGQVTQPDTLLVLASEGRAAPQKIGGGYGGINAFFLDGPDALIAPFSFKGEIARIDVNGGSAVTIARGLGDVVAARRGTDGDIYAVEWTGGRLLGVNITSGSSRVVANLGPPLDNLAVGPDGVLYVSRPSDNSIFAVNPKTGDSRTLIQGHLAAPGALIVDPETSKLMIADVFGYRTVDPATGAVSTLPFDLFANGSTGIAADEKILVISHLLRGAIIAKDKKSGKTLQTWTSVKTPMHLAIRDGRILAADFSAGEIVELSLDEPKAKRVIAAGLAGPVGLAVGQDGRLIVAEALSGRLVAIDQRGAISTIVDGLRQPEGLALDAGGGIVVAEVGARRVIRVQADSRQTQVVGVDLPLGSALGAGVAPVNLPTGVAIAADGSIYVSCDINNSIVALRPVK